MLRQDSARAVQDDGFNPITLLSLKDKYIFDLATKSLMDECADFFRVRVGSG